MLFLIHLSPGMVVSPVGKTSSPVWLSLIGVVGKLWATGASEMFQAGVPEKIVQERTGHRSIKALRMYERTTTSQHMAVSNVLLAAKDVTFSSGNSCSDAPAKQGVAGGSVCFTSIFGNTSNCVINVNTLSAGGVYIRSRAPSSSPREAYIYARESPAFSHSPFVAVVFKRRICSVSCF